MSDRNDLGIYDALVEDPGFASHAGQEQQPQAPMLPQQQPAPVPQFGAGDTGYDALIQSPQFRPDIGLAPQPAPVPQVRAMPQEPATWRQRLRSGITESIGKGFDIVSGAKRREFDIPEIPATEFVGGETIDITGPLAAARGNPLGMAAIYMDLVPGAQVDFDKFGNPRVTYASGRQAYLNRPGISGQDVTDIMAQTLAAGGAARGGGAFKGMANRLLGVAVAEGATSLGFDALARALGSPQKYDLLTAGASGLLGAAGEGAASAWRLLRGFLQRPNVFDYKTGKVKPGVAEILQESGIDPDLIDREFMRRLRSGGDLAETPTERARVARSMALPVEVPLTKGQRSGNIQQQQFEQEALHGAYGPMAAREMERADLATQQALRANIPEVQARLAGREAPGVAAPTEGAAQVGEALAKRAERQRDKISKAYRKAEDSGAAYTAGAVDDFADKLRGDIAVEYGLDLNPSAANLLDDLADLGGIGSESQLKALERWRRRATNEAHKLTKAGNAEGRTISEMVRAYDDFSVEVLKRGLVSGDQDAVKLWRKAVKERRNYGKVFEANRIVKQLTDPVLDENDRLLPEETLSLFFGGSNQLRASPQATRALRRVRSILGDDSEAWNSLKEEAFLRLVSNQPQTGFSAAKFSSALNNALQKHPGLMRVLFSSGDIKLLRRLEHVGLDAVPDPKATQPSKTSYTISRILQNWVPTIASPMAAAYKHLYQPLRSAGRAAEATRPATLGVPRVRGGQATFAPPQRSNIPATAGALAGPGLLGPLPEEQRRQNPFIR